MPLDYFADAVHDSCPLVSFQGSAVHKDDGTTTDSSSEKQSNEGKLIKGKVGPCTSMDLTSGTKALELN